MKASVPTNHNYYEENPLTENRLKGFFNLIKDKDVRNLKTNLFSSVFSLSTKNETLEQIQLLGFKQRSKLDDEEQLILKLYPKDNINGEREYIIQTGLFAGVVYHKGYQINITSKYGDIFMKRMLNCINDIYVDNQQTDAIKSDDTNEFQNILAYLFIQSLEKASFIGLPKHYQSISEHSHKVRGKIDLNAYVKKSIPFMGKLTTSHREQKYIQEIVDVLYFACTILEKNFGKEIHRKVLGILQELKQNYSGKYPNHSTILKARNHTALQNPAYSSFKKVIEYSEIIINEKNLESTNKENSLNTKGYLFDISQLFELYLEKLLNRRFTDWYVSSQEEITVYNNQFFKRKMFPDLVLRHKDTGKVIVFDAKYKKMKFIKNDLDRNDFYQIHSYIQYYYPNVVLGGLIYPLSIDNTKGKNFSENIFENTENEAGFIIDGIYVNDKMSMQDIIENEHQFLNRLTDKIDQLNLD